MFPKSFPNLFGSHGSSSAAIAGAALAVLGLAVGTGLAPAASADTISTFQASSGFSSIQGANGWSYAAVHYPGASTLASSEFTGTFDSATSEWTFLCPGVSNLNISSTQQNMAEGNAYFSLRYWTASRHYDSVSITGNLIATADLGANIIYYNATNQSQTNVPIRGSDTTYLQAPPTQTVAMDASLTNISAGDRIYFELQNTGLSNANGSGVMETWDPTITASYAVPEPLTLGLLGVGLMGVLLSGRRCQAGLSL